MQGEKDALILYGACSFESGMRSLRLETFRKLRAEQILRTALRTAARAEVTTEKVGTWGNGRCSERRLKGGTNRCRQRFSLAAFVSVARDL